MKSAAQDDKPDPQGGAVRTLEQVREEFRRHGISVSSWASRNGFEPSVVKDVLAGRVKGNYGKAHEIAVALGLKPKPGKPPSFLRT